MPVIMIGTYDENGEPDLMNAAWGGIYDYNQITVSLGGHVSTDNIRKSRAFTISVGTKETMAICDYVGLVSQVKVPNKLEKAGLHPIKSSKVNAPLFEEFPFTLECEVRARSRMLDGTFPPAPSHDAADAPAAASPSPAPPSRSPPPRHLSCIWTLSLLEEIVERDFGLVGTNRHLQL